MLRQTLAGLALLFAAAVPAASHAAQPPIYGAYYPGGSAERYPVSRIPADRLTHLFYAFSTIEAGRCTVGAEAPANFAALAELKKAHPHLRTLISIGGWGAGGFSDAALTEASRHGTRPASAIDPASVAPGHARRRMATPAAPACPLARGATNASW